MWALKYTFLEYIYLYILSLNHGLIYSVDSTLPYMLVGGLTLATITATTLVKNTSFLFTLKLTVSVMLLVLIRGGTPRYRYDYLTKLGWLKFFGLVVVFFLTLLLVYFLL